MNERSQQQQQQQQSRAFYELSVLILNILRSPSSCSLQQITPAEFASMLFGISLSLMLCGSLTFFIGLILMPWVLGLVLLFYFIGIVSSLSVLARAILSYINTTEPTPPKNVPAWKLL